MSVFGKSVAVNGALWVALASAAALAGPAAASGYGVSVRSNEGAVGNGVNCSYNAGGAGGCSSTGNGVGSVSPGATGPGTATQAAASGHADGVSPNFAVPPGIAASGSASADLASASLHLYSSDTGVNGGLFGAGGVESASITDTLHFTIAGAAADTITTLQIAFSVDGSMVRSGTSVDGGSNGEMVGALDFGNSDARFDLKFDASHGYSTYINALDTYPTIPWGTWTTNADLTLATFNGTYNVIGASAVIPVTIFANLYCNDGMICDYSHTAKLGLVLPNGVSFTSDSGVFLADAGPGAGGVPEPAAWALMLLGFGVTGALIRQRRLRIA